MPNSGYWVQKILMLIIDIVLIAMSLFLSYLIRFDFAIWPYYENQFYNMLPVVIAVRITSFYFLKSYRSVRRYTGVSDFIRLAKATALGTLLWVSLDSMRNTQLSLVICTVLLCLAVMHRFYLDDNFLKNRSKFVVMTFMVGGVTFLIGGIVTFTYHSSSLVSIYELSFFEALIPVSTSYQHSTPRAVIIMEGILSFFSAGAVRILPRIWGEFRSSNNDDTKSILIYGAGKQGENVVRYIRSQRLDYKIIGFVDDEPAKIRDTIHGYHVLGCHKSIKELASRYSINELIISIKDLEIPKLRAVAKICEEIGISVRHMPDLRDILYQPYRWSFEDFRVIDTSDLLGRSEVNIDTERVFLNIKNRIVLITGAGGSIGSELCRQISQCEPRKIILLGKGENSIFLIAQDLNKNFPQVRTECVIADIRNWTKICHVFKTFSPELVFHAAAHKHVYLMESDVEEAITTNVFGTRNLLRAIQRYGSERFVMISTDKAVNPTSVMGASKRLAELQVQHMAEILNRTQFVTVRFGNVLGSRGSVVPIFEEQIRSGGPVTVTHPDMTRFFMSIPEAVRLVLHSAVIGSSGELCVLDMGEPVKILDLAENMIKMAGLKPNEDIEISFTGLKQGEKLFEELITDKQAETLRKVGKIFVCGMEPLDWPALEVSFEDLEEAANNCDREKILTILQEVIPSYKVDYNTLANARKN